MVSECTHLGTPIGCKIQPPYSKTHTGGIVMKRIRVAGLIEMEGGYALMHRMNVKPEDLRGLAIYEHSKIC